MEFIFGSKEILDTMSSVTAEVPFNDNVIEFCQAISRELLHCSMGRQYPELITLGFWLRKGSLLKYRDNMQSGEDRILMGRGLVFHIAPSNVPVNFAYSLFSALLCGNANIVRMPTRKFPQIPFIVNAIEKAVNEYPDFVNKICLVTYNHDKEVTDYLSSICDVRIIWGGDITISEIRKSVLPIRSLEIAFADRFSLAVIDTDYYQKLDDNSKSAIARDFYNDTYFTDQNACTSPKIVLWKGENIENSKNEFWDRLWEIVKKKYTFQDIQGVNKLAKMYYLATMLEVGQIHYSKTTKTDNRLVRVELDSIQIIPRLLRECFDNSGYFLEYSLKNIEDMLSLCNDNHCQTISYLGDKKMFLPLIMSGIKGIDRIVPIGKTMDFDMIWDGYNLIDYLARVISC